MLQSNRDLSERWDEVRFPIRAGTRERVDIYLLRRLGWSSRARIQRLIRMGRVLLNGSPPKPATRIRPGDEIVVRLTPGGEALLPGDRALPAPLWEDPFIVVVNKPSGRLVHPVGRAVSGTIMNELHHRYRPLNERGRRPVIPKLGHRLDRETSGVLLVAKTDSARRRIQLAFENGEARKLYLAVVEGSPERPRFEIDLPVVVRLDRSKPHGNRLAGVGRGGKPARTRAEVLASGAGFSVLRCTLLTGRQNQIRAHLAAAGHPILGDTGYGSSSTSWIARSGADGHPFPERALLHSAVLTISHPIWGVEQRWRAMPPDDFLPFLESAGLDPRAPWETGAGCRNRVPDPENPETGSRNR